MPKDLNSTVNQAKDVEGLIHAALHTPMKRNKLWIITESDYDSDIYEHFFNDNVEVLPSNDMNKQGGCSRVVRIVQSVLRSSETQRIIGIRDADYMFFLPNRYHYPANIFHTDERDIEMMMLKSQSVLGALTAWDASFSVKIDQVIPVACYMGYIRIWHVKHDKRSSIKDFNISVAWNQTARPQKLVKNWKRVLREKYNRLTCEHLNNRMVQGIRNSYGLNNIQFQYGQICRGHDFVKLLSLMMIKQEYSNNSLAIKIAEKYDKMDFVNTNLYSSIQRFAARFGMSV